MTKEQVVILLATAETLQEELESCFKTNMHWAEKALAEQDRLHYETRANGYRGLMMVNTAQISAYQTMMIVEEKQGTPVLSVFASNRK